MIEFVQGDMFATRADIRVNAVNCVGIMGAGVALAFKRRYPDMFRDYRAFCARGLLRPGKLHIWHAPEGLRIVNFPTKGHWREGSRYEEIESGLNALRIYLDPLWTVRVTVPALGCGLGGLDWARVQEMIWSKLDGLHCRIMVFAPISMPG